MTCKSQQIDARRSFGCSTIRISKASWTSGGEQDGRRRDARARMLDAEDGEAGHAALEYQQIPTEDDWPEEAWLAPRRAQQEQTARC